MSDEKPDTMFGNLDMSNGHDRALLRRAIKEGWLEVDPRWDMSGSRKKKLLEKLDAALEHGDVRDIISVGKLFVQMEAQNQSDQHLANKNERLDEGKDTESVTHYVVEMPKPRRIGNVSESSE